MPVRNRKSVECTKDVGRGCAKHHKCVHVCRSHLCDSECTCIEPASSNKLNYWRKDKHSICRNVCSSCRQKFENFWVTQQHYRNSESDSNDEQVFELSCLYVLS